MTRKIKFILALLVLATFCNLAIMAQENTDKNYEQSTQSEERLFEQLCHLNKYWNQHEDLKQTLGDSDMKVKSHEDLIQFHLMIVEQNLRSANIAHLTKSQQQNREEGLDILRAYWSAKVFPQNLYHQTLTPYFIDDFNTACAVGHILRESGGEALAEKITSQYNYAFIEEMKEPQLATWAAEMGFTVEELKWIQPSYNWGNLFIDVTVEDLTCNDDGTFSMEISATGAQTNEYGIYPAVYGEDGPEFSYFSGEETITFEGDLANAEDGLFGLYIYDVNLADVSAKLIELDVSQCLASPCSDLYPPLEFVNAYVDCTCCNESLAFEITGGDGNYEVVTQDGIPVTNGMDLWEVILNFDEFDLTLIVTDGQGCTAQTTFFAAPGWCCEVAPICELYEVSYDCDAGLQLLGEGECNDYPLLIDENGNFYGSGSILADGTYVFTTETGVISPPCQEYQIIVNCDGSSTCQANAGQIISEPELCGFGVISLESNVDTPLNYEYVYLEVFSPGEGLPNFTVLTDNIAYNPGSCYYGLAYDPVNPPNLETGFFADLVNGGGCFDLTDCFEINYISAPEYGISTEPFCVGEGLFTVGITVNGGTGTYAIGENYLGNQVIAYSWLEEFIVFAEGESFYDIYPIDLGTGCGNDYVFAVESPDCSGLGSTCDIEDPLNTLPWLQEVIGPTGFDCTFGAYALYYYCVGGLGLFSFETTDCCDLQNFLYDVDGNLLCVSGGIAGTDCSEYGNLGDGELIWSCGDNTPVCELEPDSGPCEAAIPRYYYDLAAGDCFEFTYGGCEGNANNFEEYEVCLEACGNTTTVPPCTDVAGVDFGFCDAIMGIALVNGECVTVSGCLNYVIDGVDYSNAFVEDLTVCVENCTPDPCQDLNCLDIYDPVCGVDGNTYGNECYAFCAGVEIAYTGECGSNPCSYETIGTVNNFAGVDGCGLVITVGDINFEPAVLPDGFVLQAGQIVAFSYVELPLASTCIVGPIIEIICIEELEPVDCLCGDVYDPVCGADGITYDNECFALCAGTTVNFTGPCNIDPTDLPPVFTEYIWLLDYVDLFNCSSSDIVSVYDLGAYSFIFIQNSEGTTMYYEDGTFYCADAPNFSCVEAYGLPAVPSDIWSCEPIGPTCDLSNPLSFDWMQPYITNQDPTACYYTSTVTQFVYNGATYFKISIGENFSFDCPTDGAGSAIYNCEGTQVCFNGFAPPESLCSPEINAAAGNGTIIWEIGNNPEYCDEILDNIVELIEVWEWIDEQSIITLYIVNGLNGTSVYYHLSTCSPFADISSYFDCQGNPLGSTPPDEIFGCNDCNVSEEIIYSGNCFNQNPEIFEEYSWLGSIINPNNCNVGDNVTVYQTGVYNFLYVVEGGGVGNLYFQDGTYYCGDTPSFSCVAAYGLTEVVGTWICGEQPTGPCGEILDNILDIIGVDEYSIVTQYIINGIFGTEVYYLLNNCDPLGDSVPVYFDCQGNFIGLDFPQIECIDCSFSEEIIYSGICEINPGFGIFEEYPWLLNIVNPDNCNGEVIHVFDQGNYSFICVQSPSGNTFYFEDGTFYCADSPGFSCVAAYGLGAPSSTWSCGDIGPEPNPFPDYPWLNDFIDDDCTDLVVLAYNTGNYTFIYLYNESTGMGDFYFQDGTFYCSDAPNYSCVAAYGFAPGDGEWLYACGLDKPVIEEGIVEHQMDKQNTNIEQLEVLETIKVFPNPTQGNVYINLKTNSDSEQSITLFDLTGKQLQQIEIPANQLETTIELNLFDLPKGLYLIEWRSAEQSTVERLVIE